jgi:hypothetical protein
MAAEETSAERGERYFRSICAISVFSAELGRPYHVHPERNPDYRAVHIYPRKDEPGWVWLVWQNGPKEDDLHAIMDGGTMLGGDVKDAVPRGIACLFANASRL